MATGDKSSDLTNDGLSREGGAQFDLVLDASAGGQLVVPGGHMLLVAEFTREGSDLILTGPDGTAVLERDYFASENPPTLLTEGGAAIPADLATRLAGSLAPDQYAQAAPGGGANQPIGTVDTAAGAVSVIRADGSRATLQAGDAVFQGDVLETADGGSLGIIFVDDTTFSLDENGRMVLDELVFDPSTNEGSSAFTVVQGVFSFVSGQIAKSGDEAMTVRTPVATIGIRGTQVAVQAGQEGEENIITLLREEDGTVGEIIVTNAGGTQVLNQANQTLTITSYFAAPPAPVTLAPSQVEQLFGNSLSALPELSESGAAGGLERDTAAGGAVAGEQGEGGAAAEEEEAGAATDEEVAESEEGLLDAPADVITDEEAAAQVIGEATQAAAKEGIESEKVEAAEAAAEIAFQQALAEGGDAVSAAEEAFQAVLVRDLTAGDLIATAAGGDGPIDASIREAGDLGALVTEAGGGGGTGALDDFDGGFADSPLAAGFSQGVGGAVLPGATGGGTIGPVGGAPVAGELGRVDDVVVDSSAETPDLAASQASGAEDQSIALDVRAGLTDTDGSETLSVTIENIPEGSVLTSAGTAIAASDGSATLTEDQLADLAITPPENFSGQFTLEVTATATESASRAASTICSSLASGWPLAMLSRIDPANRKVSCGT